MIWTLSLGLEFCSPLCSYAGFASPLSNRNSFFTISLLFSYFFSHRLVKLDPLVGPDLSLKIHPLLALRAFCNSLKTLYFALRVEWKFETLKMWLLKSLCTSAALTCVNSNWFHVFSGPLIFAQSQCNTSAQGHFSTTSLTQVPQSPLGTR